MELDGAGNPVREYAYYPGIDQPNAMRRVSDDAVFRYTQEQPGHVSGLVGAGNVVVNKYAYTPWGEPVTTQEQVEQPLRYAAREYDEETGLYFVRARYYDPQQGRFVSEDPIGIAGGINVYAYVGNDPSNATDPSGMLECTLVTQQLMREAGASEALIGWLCGGGVSLPGITVIGQRCPAGICSNSREPITPPPTSSCAVSTTPCQLFKPTEQQWEQVHDILINRIDPSRSSFCSELQQSGLAMIHRQLGLFTNDARDRRWDRDLGRFTTVRIYGNAALSRELGGRAMYLRLPISVKKVLHEATHGVFQPGGLFPTEYGDRDPGYIDGLAAACRR